MNNYIIITDSACDIEPSVLKEWNVRCIDLSLCFADDNNILFNSQIDITEFYQKMRSGKIAKTSAINTQTFKDVFTEELQKGNDILYLGFSSALSTTFNSSCIAAKELQEEYKDKKIITINSLCASAGQGLLLNLACQKRDENFTIEEVAKFIEDNKLSICHWFTVNDLVYLKRGGRVSSTVAFIGGLLGIKPILHVDNNGCLVNVGKAIGRNASIKTLAQKYGEFAKEIDKSPVYVCHGDCIKDANLLGDILQKNYGIKVDKIVNTGPVIGAHSGPGTLALFFIGKER